MAEKNAFQKGYITDRFKVFHLADVPHKEIPLHYHDFRKLVILLAGNIFYDIEGQRYELQAGDMVLVEAGELHRPILPWGMDSCYERIIIYFSDEFFSAHKDAGLDDCFQFLKGGRTPVLSGHLLGEEIFREQTSKLTEVFSDKAPVQRLMEECHLIEFLLHINRLLEAPAPAFREPITRNQVVQEIMEYISEHLTENISIESLSTRMHLNPSYLMHLFKKETGSSVMNYLTDKRLFLARSLILQGLPTMLASESSGFTNYTSFYRAYRKRYGCAPADSERVRIRSEVVRE